METGLNVDDETLGRLVAAYEYWFGSPTRLLRSPARESVRVDVAVLVYRPTVTDQQDPEGNFTFLGTAGFGATMIYRDRRCELGIELQGSPAEAVVEEAARALVELGSAPFETGRPFEKDQILINFSFPTFPRFDVAILLDWDPVDGFRFPAPLHDVGLLRVLPLHKSEVDFVETFADRSEGCLSLFDRGLHVSDPDRNAVI